MFSRIEVYFQNLFDLKVSTSLDGQSVCSVCFCSHLIFYLKDCWKIFHSYRQKLLASLLGKGEISLPTYRELSPQKIHRKWYIKRKLCFWFLILLVRQDDGVMIKNQGRTNHDGLKYHFYLFLIYTITDEWKNHFDLIKEIDNGGGKVMHWIGN